MPRVHAPDFAGSFTWLNTPRPISMRELRGHVVVLDFWTYCCINCHHVMPVLRRIEERFADEPVLVIGVHSGKFDAERDPERIRQAIARHDIFHPVVVDTDFDIWHRFAVRSWPTIIVVRPDGTIAAHAPGEVAESTLASVISTELARARGSLAPRPFDVGAPTRMHDRGLKFPAKIAALGHGTFAVADTGHHRVLVCARDGEVLSTIGSGLSGWRDGTFDEAAFDSPHGLCAYEASGLLVCDAGNHTIRFVDLAERRVRTVAGTGLMADAPLARGDTPARETGLRSPWDVIVRHGKAIIALAGSHQLAELDLAAGTISLLAGDGREARIDGPLFDSAWAQPSGLALRGDEILVADSETSAVRALARGAVTTVTGGDLFTFGDRDGSVVEARLQHPLGVAVDGDCIVVADTYNGKLRQIDSSKGTVHTIATGLAEPGGVSTEAPGQFLVADTNAHRVVRVKDGVVTEVRIRGAKPPRVGVVRAPRPLAQPPRIDQWFADDDTETIELGGSSGTVVVGLVPSAGWKWSESPRLELVEISRRSDVINVERQRVDFGPDGARAIVELALPIVEAPLDAELVLGCVGVLCRAGDTSVCVPTRVRARRALRVVPGASPRATTTLSVEAAS